MKTARLSEVCKLVNGGTPKSGMAEYWGGDVVWLTPAEMGKRTTPYIAETARTISRTGLANCSARQVPVGAVIMSTRAPIGHLAIPEVPMAFNQGCRGLIPNGTLDTKYLYYFLWFSRDALNGLGTGATFKELSSGVLGNYPIPLPSLEEQRRIVAVLDEAFAAIATATANAEKNLANARELFDASVRETFANPDKSWERMTLKEAALDFGRGKSKHRPRKDPKLYGGDYPFIQTGDVRNCDHLITKYSQTYSAAGLAQSKLWPKGTICITIAANIAETGILNFEACFPDSVIGMVVDPVRTSNSYVEYLLQSLKAVLQAKGKGSAQANINLATFENERFPFPPKDAQMAIVAELGGLSEQVQDMETLYADKLVALDALKQSLLHRAFSGELTASKLKGNDSGFKTPAFTANVIALAYRRHLPLGTENTFGRVKAQKVLHLCESVGMVDLGRNPMKDAAGPNDFQHMLAAEDWAKTNQFFEFEPRPTGSGYTFKKLARFELIVAEGMAALKPVQGRLDKAIALIAPMKSEQAELLATVHAAWNNLILDGAEPTEEAIIYEARENWHGSKLKFADNKFREAIATIRTKGIIPDGTAKRVGGQDRLL
ncbi:MAG: restriction endonuclease subunit S [Sphingobium sp.]|nr:MAG: restriction endonuclease subunit S [Sphingobium sp.]